MIKKMLFLLLVLLTSKHSLFATDPIDTVWSFSEPYGISHYDLSPDEHYVITVSEITTIYLLPRK